MKDAGLIIHTDGGARGNPGPSACAFVAEDDGKIICKETKSLGINTNNFAEYNGVILALEWLDKNKDRFLNKNIYLFADSELIVNQLTGIYRIKNEQLQILNKIAKELVKRTGMKILFKNVPRSQNRIADLLVNKELDKRP